MNDAKDAKDAGNVIALSSWGRIVVVLKMICGNGGRPPRRIRRRSSALVKKSSNSNNNNIETSVSLGVFVTFFCVGRGGQRKVHIASREPHRPQATGHRPTGQGALGIWGDSIGIYSIERNRRMLMCRCIFR